MRRSPGSARVFGVDESRLLLTNGLDEGLLAATVGTFSTVRVADGLPEAIVPLPAFEMYSVFVNAAGGCVIPIQPGPKFEFPVQAVCDAISARTRIIFLTNPNNPTGQLIPPDAIRRIAACLPAEAAILLDEAYYDFCGETFLSDLPAHPNVVIGRTFAKAHGLAGLRAGCLIGDARRLAAMRSVVPPYSLSVFAVAGWRAALRDRAHLEWYRGQVDTSRQMLYAACDRLSLPYWRSAGNYVLINVARCGSPAAMASRFAERGILVRDRSRDAGCQGCIRITAGLVSHTEMAIAALEALCVAA
jgi:histidinol-phosphate aminotransferase